MYLPDNYSGAVIHCKPQGYINKRLISMSKNYYRGMFQHSMVAECGNISCMVTEKLLPKHPCYIIKVCDLTILYALLPICMGPLRHKVGPGQNAPAAPPVGGPAYLYYYYYSI